MLLVAVTPMVTDRSGVQVALPCPRQRQYLLSRMLDGANRAQLRELLHEPLYKGGLARLMVADDGNDLHSGLKYGADTH